MYTIACVLLDFISFMEHHVLCQGMRIPLSLLRQRPAILETGDDCQ